MHLALHVVFGAVSCFWGPLVPQRHATASLAGARVRHRRRGAARGGVATIAADDRRWEPLLAAGVTYAAMAAMFGDATDWSACTALLAAGGVGALVSCACAMADDEPTAEDAAAAWGAQRDTRQAATVTWDGEKHPPAPTHRAAPSRKAWGEEAAAPAKTAPAGAPEATATVTPAAAVPAPAATKTSFWAASAATEAPLAEPVTFEQATGAARLEAARRCRAAEVTESERQFMREFTAMMAAGLVVVLRVDGSDGVAVTLSLQEFRNEPILEWHFTENGERGRLSLSDIQTVRGQSLNDELARRSFVIEAGIGSSFSTARRRTSARWWLMGWRCSWPTIKGGRRGGGRRSGPRARRLRPGGRRRRSPSQQRTRHLKK